MKLAIFDTECSGTDPKKDVVVEVATVLYSVEHAAPIETYAAIVSRPKNRNEAADINGIPTELLVHGAPEALVWVRTKELFKAADFVIAHQAEFDRDFTPEDVRTLKPWICSMNDLTFPKGRRGSTLAALALAHGVPVISAHRALADVDTLMRIFQRVQETGADIGAMMAKAQRPKVLVQAMVSFDDKDLAKAEGFRWEPAPKKRWVKKMFKDDADTAKYDFSTRVVPQ